MPECSWSTASNSSSTSGTNQTTIASEGQASLEKRFLDFVSKQEATNASLVKSIQDVSTTVTTQAANFKKETQHVQAKHVGTENALSAIHSLLTDTMTSMNAQFANISQHLRMNSPSSGGHIDMQIEDGSRKRTCPN